MADLPVPDIENDVTANVPRVLGVRSDDSLALAPNVEALPLAGGTLTGDLQVGGVIQLPNARTDDIEVTAAPNLYLTSNGNVRYTTFQAAPKTFNIAEGVDTADVLDRAETATMPVVDDEGVATTDAEVESLTVNEVMTALVLKVKELSARVSQLEKDIKQ